MLIEMAIKGLMIDQVTSTPIIVLRDKDATKVLEIWVGVFEANAIALQIENISTPRPMTHDLVTDMLGELGAEVVRITVTELKENTFYASITVQQNGSEIEIDSRPSDAIALAVRAEAPIFAAEDVIEESAIEFEGEDVDQEVLDAEVAKFRHFLDEVTPEDFAVENGDDE